MRFQCTFCFTIIRTPDDQTSGGILCPSCHKRVALPRNRFEGGCVINDFVIDSLIAHGGMASVYLARQLSMDRHVALKILKADYLDQPTFVESFMKEAKSAARLNHPNIIQALAVGEEDGALFYAMEYVKGETLAGKIERDKNLELDTALNIVQQSAEALHAAWTQEGLIHRDIKPENIMLVDNGIAKIMDLGIAISKYDSENAEISGTPTFMAPEQFRRNRLDCRTDIYALGATLYNCLVGYPPFDGDRVEEIARMHLFDQLEFPDRNLIYIPQRVKHLIARMMAKSPDDRFPDYDQLLEEIVAIRRRLAPDDSVVPSVHTISFSKYRLREEMSESPSEIYRRRSEKKKNIAIAKQQQATSPKGHNRVVPLLTGVLVLLLLVILGLLGLVWNSSHKEPRFFVDYVHSYLVDHDKLLAADATDQEALQSALRTGDRILGALPPDPSELEREAYYQLKDQMYALNVRLVSLKTEVLTVKNDQFADRAKEVEEEREAQKRDMIAINTAKDQLSTERREFETRQAELVAREAAMALRQLETDKANAAVLSMREALVRPVKYQLQVRLIDLMRNHMFTDAIALANPKPTDTVDLNLWRDLKRREITDAAGLILAVGASGTHFKGYDNSRGKIQSISRTTIRFATIEKGLEVVREYPLTVLDSRELIDLAKQLDPPLDDLPNRCFHLALCYGNFPLARQYQPPQDDPSYLDSLITGTYQAMTDEIVIYNGIGQKNFAKARAIFVKSRFEGLPGYEDIEKRLVDLLRGGPRIATGATAVAATDATAGATSTTPVDSSTTMLTDPTLVDPLLAPVSEATPAIDTLPLPDPPLNP